jgi:hypothetical protein
MAPEGFLSGVRLAPVIILWEAIAADEKLNDLPDALTRTQPGPLTVSTFFIRPRAGNLQAACGGTTKNPMIACRNGRFADI